MKLFKKLNKGFTLVELVVVIAVIAILSAVSVVAYTGITKNAKKTTAMEEARNAYMVWVAQKDASKESLTPTIDIKSGEYWFHVADGNFDSKAHDSDPHTEESSPNYTIATGEQAEQGLVLYSPAQQNSGN